MEENPPPQPSDAGEQEKRRNNPSAGLGGSCTARSSHTPLISGPSTAPQPLGVPMSPRPHLGQLLRRPLPVFSMHGILTLPRKEE